jgi:Helicase HerA, central domain
MSTLLGRYVDTQEPAEIGDIERRRGVYVLGRSGTGKSSLLVKMMEHDVKNGHGVFFLDPHGDANENFRTGCDLAGRTQDIIILDPEKEEYSFAINLLSCKNLHTERDRQDTYDRSYTVFEKLWGREKEFGVWLQSSLQHTLNTFIENPGYTLAELPHFLTNIAFRNQLIGNIKHNWVTAAFWHNEFAAKRDSDQVTYLDPLLNRVNTFLGHRYVKHIVGQTDTTIDFPKIIQKKRIVLIKFSPTLSSDVKRSIGTILVSELLHAIKKRGELKDPERHQFCIFIDEVHDFTVHKEISWLFAQGRKFGIAPTIAHQERYGQFADNKEMLGATNAAGNKICFQLSPADAQEQAIEFERAPPTETKRERELLLVQEPVSHLLRYGHRNPDVLWFVNQYLRVLQERREDTKEDMERLRIERQEDMDEAGIYRIDAQIAGADEREKVDYDAVRGALARARVSVEGAHAKSGRLLSLFDRSNNIRLILRGFDKFLIAVMEGKIAPGQESFSDFVIERVHYSHTLSGHVRELFDLYIALSYGDPNNPRPIPFWFAKEHGFYQDTLSVIEKDAEEKVRLKRQATVDDAWENYRQRWREEAEREKFYDNSWRNNISRVGGS